MSDHYSTDRYEIRHTLPDPPAEYRKWFRDLVYKSDKRVEQLSELVHHAEQGLMPMAETKEGRARIQRDIDGAIAAFCKDIYQITQTGRDFMIEDVFIISYPKGYDLYCDDEDYEDHVRSEVDLQEDPDYISYYNLGSARDGYIEYDHPDATDYMEP